MSDRPTVFVGSASEAAEIDRDVRATLESLGTNIIGWREIFRPGDYALEALLNLGATVDGALLIVTPDDLTTYRGGERMSPRDNVLLELGMFLALFGKRRAGILHVKFADKIAALPSDLTGITTLVFDPVNPSRNEQQLSLWLKGVNEEMESQHPALPRVVGSLRETFNSLPATWHDEVDRYIVSSFVSALSLASRGQIVLTPGQYYQAIGDEMQLATSPRQIMGVATLSSQFWHDDREQRRYLASNLEAARRDADIRRVFIVSDQEWPTLHSVVRQQLEAGIRIRRARPAILAELPDLEDMVVFVDPEAGVSRAYIADHYFDDSSKIRRGRLVFGAEDRGQLLDSFERLWALASMVTLRDLIEIKRERHAEQVAPEPSRDMKEFALARPVVTCEEAARAKGIPLRNELKTLLLATQKGFVALHLPGDVDASFRSVKKALEVREACLATPDELASFGLRPGTVCAIKDPIWGLPHLISKRVLQMEMISTNNGTQRGFYRFHPSVLLEADSVMLGHFEAAPDDA